ncbi:MAG TPA: hypothetical protein VF137_11115 [Candidatus Dormibacteraeota bacterium]
MNRFEALRELPTTHAVAIRLRDGGFDDHGIAVALDIEDNQVPMLLRIANRKLANLIAAGGPDNTSAAQKTGGIT